MAGLNISLNRRQSSSDKKYKLSFNTSGSVFSLPLLFCRLSTVFFIDSETNESIPTQFPKCFSLFLRQKPFEKTFLVECLRNGAVRGAASCKRLLKAGILARSSQTPVASDWMYRFAHTWKNIVRDSYWVYQVFHL